jgi:YD repeat-containing protein
VASATAFAYDATGNLTDDGVYRYQYDAWGRLIAVHLRTASGGYGAYVRAYNYDGLGRLTRAQSPYPDTSAAEGSNRIERYYYDGVRRIQERVVDPVPSLGEALSGAMGGESQQAAQQSQQQSGVSNAALTLEDEATPLAVEGAQSNAASTPPPGEGGTAPPPQAYPERDYVWGPGDGWGVAGTDELLAQFDRTNALTFAITDAGGDLVALVDAGGTSGTARVVGQWTYDAYGNVHSADYLHAHAYTRVGHKGLIFDRLDAAPSLGGIGVADEGHDGTFTQGQFVGHPACGFDVPGLVPFAKGIYHNRNRVYMPELGRFTQADPNASGQTLLDLPVYHGRAITAAAVNFDFSARYADGGSLFAYMGGNPWVQSDSMGLLSWGGAAQNGLLYALPGPADMIRSVLAELLTDYAANMEWDFEWAMDWSMDDRWSERNGNRTFSGRCTGHR